MIYLESPPSPHLRSVIKHFWAIEHSAQADAAPEPVMPDGCIEIVFNFSDRFRRLYADGNFTLQPRTLIAGQMSRGIVIAPSGAVDLFGIRFRPSGFFSLSGLPASELTDRIEDVSDIWSSLEPLFYERLASLRSFEERVTAFEQFVLKSFPGTNGSTTEIDHAVAMLADNMPVRRLAKDLEWSERRLERHFLRTVGVKPKLFARISRFQRLLRMLESGDATTLADAAIAAGYYDQPHMNRDFAEFAQATPTEFRASSHRISELFVSGG